MTKQFREAQIEWYINKIGILNYDWGAYDSRVYKPKDFKKIVFKLEARFKRELSRPITEGEL